VLWRLNRLVRALVVAAAIAALWPAQAAAADEATARGPLPSPDGTGSGGRSRLWAGGAGPGATIALGGPARTGLCAVAALYPGAWAGRFGIRVEARTTGGDDRFASGLFIAGLTYEAAAARPRLSLALHGDGGATAPDPRPAIGGGVELQLWILGPVALALDGSAHLIVDGLDSEIVLAGAIGLRLAR
jgi:hypothetical protein